MELQRRSVQARRWLGPVPMPVMARPRRRQLHVELVSNRAVECWQQVYVLMTAAPSALAVVMVMLQGVGGL